MNSSIAQLRRRASIVAATAAASMMIFGSLASVSAASLTASSLELSDPRPDQTSTYTVGGSSFTTGTTIGCIEVALNDQADGLGSIPSSIDTQSSTLASSTLVTVGTWSVDNSTNGVLRATSVGGETPSATGNVVWGAVVNGDTDQTYYAEVTTFTDAGCTGGNEVDNITIAYVYKDGTLVSLTLEPTLLFVVNQVLEAGATAVNSQDITLDSGPTSIDFGTAVTASTNGVTAHDLAVTTNASGGYNVYIRDDGQLVNESSDVIANSAGVHATPIAFTAAGTEGWGYTTEDADIAQFAGNLWAGFTTSNELVMTNSAATAGSETVRVGHQVGIANSTPAGTYTSTMIYTIVATY